jgi:hypothetical protein
LICDDGDALAQPIRFAQFCANRAKIASPGRLPETFFSPASSADIRSSRALLAHRHGSDTAQRRIKTSVSRIYTNAQMQLMLHLAQYGCSPHIY